MTENAEGQSSARMGWAVFQACAALSISYTAALLLILRPLWYEMDIFIAQMTGIALPWSALLLIVAAASAMHCCAGYLILQSGRRPGPGLVRKISVPILVLLWGLLLLVLFQESSTSLPSVCPSSRLCLYFAAVPAALLAVFALARLLRGRRDASRRGRDLVAGAFALLSLLFGLLSAAAFSAEGRRWPAHTLSPSGGWEARWISAADHSLAARLVPEAWRRSPANSWTCFRKSFALPARPGSFRLRIGADSTYRLWVNGELAVAEGGLKRGPRPGAGYYDLVDIAPHLREGRNLVAVLLWHFGKDGFAHADSGRAGLVVESAGAEGPPTGGAGHGLKSDASWKARIHPAYYRPSGLSPNFRLAESNVGFDARKDSGEWTSPSYDDSAWEAARELGSPPGEPWGELSERPIPAFRFGPIRDYERIETSRKGDRDIVRCELPYNAQAIPWMRLRAPSGARIGIQTDHYTGGGALGLRAEYVAREGMQDFECPLWLNGETVIYSIPRGTELLALGYRETGYDADFAGSFECEDPFYGRLWEKARRTLYLCMRDNYMDCPDRERAQWWNSGIEAGQAFRSLSRSSDLLARKAMLELVDWQRADGVLYSPVPSGNWSLELPLPMLASVGERGFWNYYLHTGDRETLERVYPGVMRYLGLWKTEGGLALPRRGGWNWGDWGTDIDMPLLTNAWYYLALKGAGRMARTLGKDADAASLSLGMAALEAAFDGAFWTGSAYRSSSYRGETDDRSNALAVVAGLVPRERYEAIRAVFAAEFHASPFMESFVLEALFMMGYDDEALARMKKRFGPMVESPLSTLWEGWDIGSETYGGGTSNHAWSGGGLTLLSRYAAGLSPTLPGFEEFSVMPQEGKLRSVKSDLLSPRGRISVEIRNEGERYSLDLALPPGTRATVGLHSRSRDGGRIATIAANGATVWRDGAAQASAGIGLRGDDGRYQLLEVGEGRWSFVATYR